LDVIRPIFLIYRVIACPKFSREIHIPCIHTAGVTSSKLVLPTIFYGL
jgi:hypothetical protein